MAGRRELERRLHALGDIGAILGVMKNLALMESGKLARTLAAQQELTASLETIAADFTAWYPQPRMAAEATIDVLLLVGSQRGFCGEFNDLILNALAPAENGRYKPLRIAVGDKLTGRIAADIKLAGPYAAEEIGPVIQLVMETITALLSRSDGGKSMRLVAIHHDPDTAGVIARQLAPFVEQTGQAATFIFPPYLNIAPEALYGQLAGQHLLAAIHEVFHRSLMAENRFRLNHIEGASRRMERRITELKRKQTLARQEEIIEEIEAILAGAGLDDTEAVGGTAVSAPPVRPCSAG
jgi:F-type H+-transporting ATPase subunit gamma